MPGIDAGGTKFRYVRVGRSLLFGLSVALCLGAALASTAASRQAEQVGEPLHWDNANGGPKRALIQSQGRGKYKPADFCPANHTCFSEAEWINWDRTAMAWATGTTVYPGASEFSERVRVTFRRVRKMCGGWRYTRARWQYSGDSQPTESSFLKLSGCGYWSGA